MKRLIQNSNSIFFDGSIARKVVLVTAGSSLITLFFLITIFFIRDWNNFNSGKIEQLATMATLVGNNSTAAIEFMHFEDAQELVDSLESEPDVQVAALYDGSGALMAFYARSAAKEPPALPEFRGSHRIQNQLFYIHDIEDDGVHVGTLLITADATSHEAYFLNSIVISLALLLVGLIVAVFISVRSMRVITKPITELANLAQRVSNENNYTYRAVRRYNDEVGSLVDSFNFMMSSVEVRDKALNSSHRTLELKVAERTHALSLAVKEAKEASKAKSEFLSTVSHELRTPMNAIVGMAGLLHGDDLDKERREYVDIIRKSSDALLSLINDVLDYSKIESGRLELETQPFELLACLEEVMDIVSVQRREDILFLTSVDAQLPNLISGDVTRLRQILMNLVGNAAKFTSEGYIILKAFLRKDECQKEWLCISVRDTGIGIPADRMDRLFKHFSQVDSSTTRRFGGTGLGLAISQRLVQLLGGDIIVESQEGVGSEFRIQLPLCRVGAHRSIIGQSPMADTKLPVVFVDVPLVLQKELCTLFQHWEVPVAGAELDSDHIVLSWKTENTSGKSAESSVLPFRDRLLLRRVGHTEAPVPEMEVSVPITLDELRGGLHALILPIANRTQARVQVAETKQQATCIRVLLAEDNLLNQRVFKLLMKHEGIEDLTIVNNGREALQAVQDGVFDLVFMDYQMPVMDGIKATEHIRALNGKVAQPWIVALTADAQVETASRTREAGMNDFLTKPVRNSDLREAILRFTSTVEKNKPVEETFEKLS